MSTITFVKRLGKIYVKEKLPLYEFLFVKVAVPRVKSALYFSIICFFQSYIPLQHLKHIFDMLPLLQYQNPLYSSPVEMTPSTIFPSL